MDVKVNVISDSVNEVEVTLDYDEIKSEIEEAYKEERKNLTLPGFRKGKAPLAMLKKMYGEAIEYRASEKIAQKKFWDVADEKGLKPVSTPQLVDIDFEIGKKLSFKVKYEIKPKLELKDYKGIEIEKPIFKTRDEDVEKEIEYLLKAHGTYQEAEVVEGEDFRITCNLQGLDENGNARAEARSENMVIDLQDTKVNPQIVQNAQGKKTGEKFEFTFIDEHYHGEEKHRVEYKYEAEITKIEKLVPPEITEELIKKISKDKATTLDELKAEIRTNIETFYKEQSESIYTNSLLNTVVKNNDFTPPPGYVENILTRMTEMEKENAKRYGQNNFDEHAAMHQLQPRAEWNAKWQIILENISEAEGIKVEDADLETLAKEEAEKTGISVEKLIKYYKDTNRPEMLLEEKVINFLKENTSIKEVDADEKSKENKDAE